MEETRLGFDDKPKLGEQTKAGVNLEETVMLEFKAALYKTMKITPEAFFRICDIEYQQEVT